MSLTVRFDSEGKSRISSSAALTPALPQLWGAAGTELCGHWWLRGGGLSCHIPVPGEYAESCSEGLGLGDTGVQHWSAGLSLPVAARAAGRGSGHVCGHGGGQVRAEGLGLG